MAEPRAGQVAGRSRGRRGSEVRSGKCTSERWGRGSGAATSTTRKLGASADTSVWSSVKVGLAESKVRAFWQRVQRGGPTAAMNREQSLQRRASPTARAASVRSRPSLRELTGVHPSVPRTARSRLAAPRIRARPAATAWQLTRTAASKEPHVRAQGWRTVASGGLRRRPRSDRITAAQCDAPPTCNPLAEISPV